MTIAFGTACQACHTRGVNRRGETCLRCSGTGLEPSQHATARRSDPETSHSAARSIPSEAIRQSQALILSLLREEGPMTDDRIWYELQIARSHNQTRAMSASGARTRRSELVRLGLVEDSGETALLPSGRRAVKWAAR